MRKIKSLLAEFEMLELKKNHLADVHHNSIEKCVHFHSLKQVVVRQLDIFNILKARVESFDGNSKMKKNGFEIFDIIEHHLHLELGRIHAKDLEGLYDLVQDINESVLKDGLIVEYLLNVANEKDFDFAIEHIDNSRTYTWVRPKLLGLGVAMSLVLSSVSRSVLGSSLSICDE